MASQPLAQESKRCSRCRECKPANREHFSFIRCRGSWHPWCKPCCAEQRREDRAKRPEHYAKIDKACRDRDREVVRARVRAKYWRTRDERLESERARMSANRERYAANRRLRRQTDPDWAQRQRDKAKQRRLANLDRYREYAKGAWAKAPPQRRLRNFFTAAICHSLQGRTKGGRSWETILGYSAIELRTHLERQFLPGMRWDNYGEWHVDHILPVASFNFETADDSDFRACWALTNLRPMWAADNIRKSDKRLYLI
jgi:hypothetical protein